MNQPCNDTMPSGESDSAVKRNATISIIATLWSLIVLIAILEMNLPFRLFVIQGQAAHCGWPVRAVDLQRKTSDAWWTVATVHTAGAVANLIVAVLLVAGSNVAILAMLRLADFRSIRLLTLLSIMGMAATYIAIGVWQWQPSIYGNDRLPDMAHEFLFVVTHTSIAISWLAFPTVVELRRRRNQVVARLEDGA